jgi:hypothetical protein
MPHTSIKYVRLIKFHRQLHILKHKFSPYFVTRSLIIATWLESGLRSWKGQGQHPDEFWAYVPGRDRCNTQTSSGLTSLEGTWTTPQTISGLASLEGTGTTSRRVLSLRPWKGHGQHPDEFWTCVPGRDRDNTQTSSELTSLEGTWTTPRRVLVLRVWKGHGQHPDEFWACVPGRDRDNIQISSSGLHFLERRVTASRLVLGVPPAIYRSFTKGSLPGEKWPELEADNFSISCAGLWIFAVMHPLLCVFRKNCLMRRGH